MDRLNSWALLADSTCRRVTRYQVREIQRVFPFLDLPAELRLCIYELCVNFSGIKAFFDKNYKIVSGSPKDPRGSKAPKKKTPTIFLLNKQIYLEAIHLLRKEKVVFDHGLLKISQIRNIVSSNVLRQVSTIEISDAGHPLLKSKVIPESWHGHMRLLGQLADLLAKGHQLKEFIVHFSDPRLKEHMTDCFQAEYVCGFRDGMSEAINKLRKIRGVGKVTFYGINEELAAEVKAHMESKPKTLLDLPLEIRDMIYSQALDWSDVSRSLIRSIANSPDPSKPFRYPRRTTPTVLLLNKQISTEALDVLRKKPLTLTFPAHTHITKVEQVPHILNFISRTTLKQVTTLHMTMESWQWVYNISRSLVAALAASPNLKTLHIIIKDDLKAQFLHTAHAHYPDARLHSVLKKLADIRGLAEVSFEGGDLPLCYTDPLARIMTSPMSALEVLPKMRAITRKGKIVDIREEEDEDEEDVQEMETDIEV